MSQYIKCGSESSCDKREAVAGFAAWFSCPVCAYRICSGCAAVDTPGFADRKERTVENLFATQFANFGKDPKVKPRAPTADVENGLPGQAA